MSDEFLFDSERQQKKADRKRKLLPFLVLAGVILLAVIVALLLRSGKGEIHTGGEDTDYPYTWALKSEGDVELTVPHDDAPESRWVLKDGEDGLPALRVTRAEKESKGGTVFTLHPEEEGRCLFTLVLTGAGQDAARSYEMKLLAEITRSGEGFSTALLNASGTRLQAELSGGTESENPYRIFTNERNELVISVPVSEIETDWQYEIPQGEESLELLGLIYEGTDMNAYLRGGETPGVVQLVLKSEMTAMELRLSLETGADGSLQVLFHEAVYAEKPEVVYPTESLSDEEEGEQEEATEETREELLPDGSGDEAEQGGNDADAQTTEPAGAAEAETVTETAG